MLLWAMHMFMENHTWRGVDQRGRRIATSEDLFNVEK